MTQAPPSTAMNQGAPGGMRPHRGTMILVLGILSIVCCQLLGIFAWVMGNNDLAQMRAGQMDPSGEGMTTAGKICGIVGLVILVLSIVMYVISIVVFGGAIWAAGASGAGTP